MTVYSLHHCEGCARLKEIKSMTNKLQTAAVAFLIFLSTLCSAQSDALRGTVFTASGSVSLKSTVIDVEKYQPVGHMMFGCSPNAASCYMPTAGETGYIVGTMSGGPYAGKNLLIFWNEAKMYSCVVLVQSY